VPPEPAPSVALALVPNAALALVPSVASVPPAQARLPAAPHAAWKPTPEARRLHAAPEPSVIRAPTPEAQGPYAGPVPSE